MEHLLYHRMTIGKHFIFIGTGGRDAESAKTLFQTIRCVMESLRWHNWWQTTSRQTPGESGLCLQWTNPFNDSYCLMFDKYSLSRLPTTVELTFKRCVIRMAVLFLVDNSFLNSLTFLIHLLFKLKYSLCLSVQPYRSKDLLDFSFTLSEIWIIKYRNVSGSHALHLHSGIQTRTFKIYKPNISKTINMSLKVSIVTQHNTKWMNDLLRNQRTSRRFILLYEPYNLRISSF